MQRAFARIFSGHLNNGTLAAASWLLLSASAAAVSAPTTTRASAATGLADCAETRRLSVGGGELLLKFDTANFQVNAAQICAWTERAAQAITHYFARFPVRKLRIVFRPADSDRVPMGSTYGHVDGEGPVIYVELGRRADPTALERDWVLPHEMTHLVVPSVPERSHWLEEGIATYVEPVARAQLGELSKEKVWRDMIDGLPNGLPKSGDRGLDQTPTWGRTYWGGALFCLLADVAIRQRTHNQKGLREALRGVIEAGGSIEQDWSVARVLEAGDRAVGVPVLSELYAAMATAPGPDKLDDLWRDLGVTSNGGRVSFASDAPLATVRDAITAP